MYVLCEVTLIAVSTDSWNVIDKATLVLQAQSRHQQCLVCSLPCLHLAECTIIQRPCAMSMSTFMLCAADLPPLVHGQSCDVGRRGKCACLQVDKALRPSTGTLVQHSETPVDSMLQHVWALPSQSHQLCLPIPLTDNKLLSYAVHWCCVFMVKNWTVAVVQTHQLACELFKSRSAAHLQQQTQSCLLPL